MTANIRDILGERTSVFVVKYIWIDSICINQVDDVEKGKQVKQMQKIYSNATQTTICLGHTPRAATAHRFLSKIVRRILVPQNVTLTSAMPIKEDNSKFVALKELLLHPYWFRAWIVQEIAASKTIRVLYGRQFVDWEAFMFCIKSLNSVESGSMIQVLDSSGGPAALPFAALAQVNMLNILRRNYQDGKKLSILDILISCPVVRATNPCDRIFALRGISLEADTDVLAPDYTRSLPDIYMSTALHALNSEKPFRLFPFAGLALKFKVDKPETSSSPKIILPTWVADWRHIQMLPQLTPMSTLSLVREFEAAKHEEAHFSVSADSSILKVKGVLVDKIFKIATIPP
jgi:hypothetical protein